MNAHQLPSYVLPELRDRVLHELDSKPATLETANAAYETASKLYHANEPIEAAVFFAVACVLEEWLLGKDHPDTLTSLNDLAACYQEAGRPGKALDLHMRVLAGREAKLGRYHPHTLASSNNLAVCHRDIGQLSEAIGLLELNLKVQLLANGADDSLTLVFRNNLAEAYALARRVTEAMALLEFNLHERRRVLGPRDPQTLGSCTSLAVCYCQAGRPMEGIARLESNLSECRDALGSDDFRTLCCLMCLVDACNDAVPLAETNEQAVDLLVKAQDWSKVCLDEHERVLGRDHLHTLRARNTRAICGLDATRRVKWPETKLPTFLLAKSLELLEFNLSEHKRVLGDNHPQTFSARNNLAFGYYLAAQLDDGTNRSAGRLADAIKLHTLNLKDRFRVLSPNHPDTLVSRINLASCHIQLGRLSEAEAGLTKSLESMERVRVSGGDALGRALTSEVLGLTAR